MSSALGGLLERFFFLRCAQLSRLLGTPVHRGACPPRQRRPVSPGLFRVKDSP